MTRYVFLRDEFQKKMTTPSRKLRHTAVASLTVYRDKRGWGMSQKQLRLLTSPTLPTMLSFLQCRVYFFHHFEFYFRYRQLIVFPAWGHSCSGCQGEMSSTFFFPGSYTIHPLMLYVSILEVFFIVEFSSLLRSSSYFRSSLF